MGDNNVKPEHRTIGPPDQHAKHIMRPIWVIWIVVPVLVLGGLQMESRAPDLFTSIGGWVTVIGILFVASSAVSLTMVRRVRRRNSMPDERSGSARD